MDSTSLSEGTFCRVHGCSVNNAAARTGSTAFFAPPISSLPRNAPHGVTINFSDIANSKRELSLTTFRTFAIAFPKSPCVYSCIFILNIAKGMICIKIYGYCRVSGIGQNEDRQLLAMEAQGIPPERVFSEKLSEKNLNRPILRSLMETVQGGNNDVSQRTAFLCIWHMLK